MRNNFARATASRSARSAGQLAVREDVRAASVLAAGTVKMQRIFARACSSCRGLLNSRRGAHILPSPH